MPAKLTALPPQSEKSFAAQVDHLAKLMGWRIGKTWLSVKSPAGFPDRVFVRPPRLIFAELKRENGKLSLAQEEWIADLHHVPGVETYVWRPADWSEIANILAR